ncbi:UNKNOWN [Stylonychia lemnae]|uniref:Uncharacterized protein n=1 Tax=Stylonychia lemnae TaxID=5949 RepID=A0A078ANF2_STYLE|nr:UNKNOWN [Stylonychia lemnae]|eukprot:CDW82867.1 UNKNOWN [Stylonychia lemnae]
MQTDPSDQSLFEQQIYSRITIFSPDKLQFKTWTKSSQNDFQVRDHQRNSIERKKHQFTDQLFHPHMDLSTQIESMFHQSSCIANQEKVNALLNSIIIEENRNRYPSQRKVFPKTTNNTNTNTTTLTANKNLYNTNVILPKEKIKSGSRQKSNNGKNKENKFKNSNKGLNKIQTEVQLNNIKALTKNNRNHQNNKTQNIIFNPHIPLTQETFSPKRQNDSKNQTLNRIMSNNGLIKSKAQLLESRPLSPISNPTSDGNQWLISEKSCMFQDQALHQRSQYFSPNQEKQKYSTNDNQRMPQSHINVRELDRTNSRDIELRKKPQCQNHSQAPQTVKNYNAIQQMRQIQQSQQQHFQQLPSNLQSCNQQSDQCERCLKLENKIVRIAVQLDQLQLSNTNDSLEMLELISNTIIEFKLQKHQHEQDKIKLQQDVEKLIQNQESFELRVKEMDDVFGLLMKEKERLKLKKQEIDQLLSQRQDTLTAYKKELQELRDNSKELKVEIRRVVEKEVKETIYRKYRDRDYIFDYPCQINADSNNRSKQDKGEQLPSAEIKKRESELDKKESKLYEWEAQLFERKLKIDNQDEQLKGKMEKMTAQKSEIQQNLKKLQILTKDYEAILQKEYEMTKLAEEIRTSKQLVETQKQELERTHRQIMTQREYLQREKLDGDKVDKYIQRVKDQTQMIVEDNMSYLERERNKCLTRMKEADELKNILTTEKNRWSQGVNDQQKKLQTLVDEKREQVLVMEVSMRQQIKEIRERQEQQEKREKELEDKFRQQQREIDQEKQELQREKEDVKCLILELEEKTSIRSGNKNNKKKYKKTNMPRQMPNQQEIDHKENTNTFEYMLNPQQNTKSYQNANSSNNNFIDESKSHTYQGQYQPQLSQQPSQTMKKSANMQNFNLDDDELMLLDVPQYSQTQQSKTPQINRKNSGMPPKPPSSTLSQSTNKLFRKDSKSQLSNGKSSQNDLSIDQDQQLEQLLMMSQTNTEVIKETKDFFGKDTNLFQFDQYLASSQNDMSLLNDDDDINFN